MGTRITLPCGEYRVRMTSPDVGHVLGDDGYPIATAYGPPPFVDVLIHEGADALAPHEARIRYVMTQQMTPGRTPPKRRLFRRFARWLARRLRRWW
ncbi:hypothetical protein [Salininema proteolyticum]|uniref:Uncharacterized protein n=1 Tax=Salininema proteolyticum TaxID=1607685 RepID=A0ABV8TSW8_9ACTN